MATCSAVASACSSRRAPLLNCTHGQVLQASTGAAVGGWAEDGPRGPCPCRRYSDRALPAVQLRPDQHDATGGGLHCRLHPAGALMLPCPCGQRPHRGFFFMHVVQRSQLLIQLGHATGNKLCLRMTCVNAPDSARRPAVRRSLARYAPWCCGLTPTLARASARSRACC